MARKRVRVASPIVLAGERYFDAGEQALALLRILVDRASMQHISTNIVIETTFPSLRMYGDCFACLRKADEAWDDMDTANVKIVKA